MGNWRHHGSGFSKTRFKLSYFDAKGIHTEEVMGSALHSLVIWDTDLAIMTPQRAEVMRECGLRFALFGQRAPESRRNPECYLVSMLSSPSTVPICHLWHTVHVWRARSGEVHLQDTTVYKGK